MAYPLTLYELGSAWCYVSDSPGARGYGPARPVTLVLRLILRLSKTPALHGDMRGTTVLGFRALKASPCGGSFPTTPPFVKFSCCIEEQSPLVLTTTGPALVALRTSTFPAQLELDARHIGARSPQ